MKDNHKKKTSGEIIFTLDTSIYPEEVIYGASYVFIDKYYIFLDYFKPRKMTVKLKGKTKMSSRQLEELEGEFYNELLNYNLRYRLAKENKKMREYVIEQALFGATNQNNSDDFRLSYDDDPLGIAIPWEEKYGSKKK